MREFYTPTFGIAHGWDMFHMQKTLASHIMNKCGYKDKDEARILGRSLLNEFYSAAVRASRHDESPEWKSRLVAFVLHIIFEVRYIWECTLAALQHQTGKHEWHDDDRFQIIKQCPEHGTCDRLLFKSEPLYNVLSKEFHRHDLGMFLIL